MPPHRLTCGTFLFRDLLAAGAVAHTALGVRHSLALKIFHKIKFRKYSASLTLSQEEGGGLSYLLFGGGAAHIVLDSLALLLVDGGTFLLVLIYNNII